MKFVYFWPLLVLLLILMTASTVKAKRKRKLERVVLIADPDMHGPPIVIFQPSKKGKQGKVIVISG